MNAFLAKHPETAAALKTIGSHPFSSGFADSPYYALNAFRFLNAKGESTPVRWWVAPDQSPRTSHLSGQELSVRRTDRAGSCQAPALAFDPHRGPARRSDCGRDAPWPPDRKQIDAGTLTIDSIESEDTSPTRDINFDPLVLPDGIAPSDDPLLSARSAAYSQSFTRREGEHKDPSAVSTAEVGK